MNRIVRTGIAAAIVTELLYGGSYVFTKGITESISPVTLLAWRFGVALVVMLALWALRIVRLTLTAATVKPLLMLAAFQPVAYYLAETFGIARTSASESGLILSAIPAVNLVFAAIVLGARPTRWQVVGISITVVGVMMTVVAGGVTLGAQAAGYLLLAAAVVAFSLYTVFAERFAHVSDLDKTFVMICAGALTFSTIALATHARAGTLAELARLPVDRPDFALAVAYLALGCTVGAFFLQNHAISTIGSNRYSTFIGVATVATLASGAIFLGERLAPLQWVGGVAILAGVYLANRPDRPDAQRAGATPPGTAQEEAEAPVILPDHPAP